MRAFLERRADCGRARGARWPRNWPGAAARWWPARAPAWTTRAFLEHLAAAKARGKMRESVENGH